MGYLHEVFHILHTYNRYVCRNDKRRIIMDKRQHAWLKTKCLTHARQLYVQRFVSVYQKAPHCSLPQQL